MGDPRPGLSGNHLALDGLEMLSGAVEFRLRHPAILKKRLLPLKIEARLDQLRLGGGKGGFRSLQGVLLGREIEPGDNLARLYQVANMDRPLDDASVEAKGEAHLVLGTNLPCQRSDLAFRAIMDGDGPNGAGLRRRRRRLVAARDGSRDQGCRCNSRLKHWRRLS